MASLLRGSTFNAWLALLGWLGCMGLLGWFGWLGLLGWAQDYRLGPGLACLGWVGSRGCCWVSNISLSVGIRMAFVFGDR